VTFDSKAKCPLFEKFLKRIFAGKKELIAYVQRSLGASLTGIVREQVLNIWWGGGANGKTVLRETVLSVLGDYGQAARAETLMVKRGDSIPSDVARLAGARFVGAIEAEEGHRLAESLVKQMTGQDRMLARFMYKDFFEFKPVFKLFLITNHKPSIRGTDHAIWRRIHLLPFEVVIPDDEQDPELIEKLWQESSGILAWLVRGCAAWQKEGLSPPPEVQAATEDYRRTEDILGQFQEESCVDRERENTEATFLYQVYKWWMQRAGEYSISQTRFGTVMAERGYERAKDPNTRRKIYKGVLVKRSVRNAVEAYLDAKR